METLGELVARDRRSGAVALRTDPADRTMSYHDFCTTAWKAGNFLRYLGVRAGDRVSIATDRRPEPVLALFGAALLGATAQFGIERSTTDAGGAPRVVVAPAEREQGLDVAAETRLLVYGGVPDQSRTAHWEGDVWSENPAFPPTSVDPHSAMLIGDTASFTHAALIETARRVAEDYELDSGVTVAVRGSLSKPGVVVAGVLAPLLAGATVVFPDAETRCDVAVGPGPEPVTLDPGDTIPKR